MPHRAPSYQVPKSGCSAAAAPQWAMSESESTSTESTETSRLQSLAGGKTVRAGSGGPAIRESLLVVGRGSTVPHARRKPPSTTRAIGRRVMALNLWRRLGMDVDVDHQRSARPSEPPVGFEPTTARLRIESSTTELRWRRTLT